MFATRLLVSSLLAATLGPGCTQVSESAWEFGWRSASPGLRGGLRFEDLVFANPNTGWVLTRRGVAKTGDGGQTWTHYAVPGRGLRSITFESPLTGWIGSLDPAGLLFETQDGGRSWSDVSRRIEGSTPGGICGLQVVSEGKVYGVGRYTGPAHFLRTGDGGKTWQAFDLGQYATRLVDLHFRDELTGIVVGGVREEGGIERAIVLRTTDGGRSWEEMHRSAGNAEWGWKISFPSALVGYVSVQSPTRGLVLKTVDGGLTWSEIAVPENIMLQGVGFITEEIGWVGGYVRTSRTEDGGQTWETDKFGENLNRFRRVADSLLAAAGTEVYLFRSPSRY